MTLVEIRSAGGVAGRSGGVGTGLRDEIEQIAPEIIGLEHTLIGAAVEAISPHASPEAVGAIELALWDLLGQESGLPLHQLWGGASDRVKLLYRVRARAAELAPAESAVGLIIEVSDSDPRRSLDAIRITRERLASAVTVGIDWQPAPELPPATQAAQIEFVGALNDLSVAWLECSPSAVAQPHELAALHDASRNTLIVGGSAAHDLRELAAIADAACCDILRPGFAHAAVTELWKAAALAEAAGLMVLLPIARDPFALAAQLHLAAALPSCEWLEATDRRGPELVVPDAPGLGLEPDQAHGT